MIPIYDTRFWGNEKKYIDRCIKTRWISSQGTFVKKFENKFAGIFNQKYCLAVSNCTVALHLALDCLNIKKGDEVICTNLTWISPANVISLSGAKLVLIDIDKTWNLNPDLIEKKITKKTKCIMVVHAFGHPANMKEILRIAKKYNLKIIEDTAEAIGSKYKGKYAGTIGDISCFSFFGNKVFTSGEGGALFFKKKKDYQNALIKRDHGISKKIKYKCIVRGFNYRMTNLQAAILLAQFEKFSNVIYTRNKIQKLYENKLKGIKNIQLMPKTKSSTVVMWLMTIILPRNISRKKFINFMLKNNVECRPMINSVASANHFKYLASKNLVISEDICRSAVHLPSSSNLNKKDINLVSDLVMKYINRHTK